MRYWIGVLIGTMATQALHAGEQPSYAKHVRPIFVKYCLECHNTKSAKGGLDLETHKGMLEGSDNGPVLKTGKADESVLVLSVEGKGRNLMPPKSKTLRPSKQEIATLRAWINAGAKDDSAAIKVAIPVIKPNKSSLPPVKAIAYTDGASTVIAARHRSWVYLPAQPNVLPDQVKANVGPITAIAVHGPKLEVIASGEPGKSASLHGLHRGRGLLTDERAQPLSAHNDIILDLAFSPDGNTLATCSYDTQVKLWDVASGKLLHTLKDHSDSVYGVSFHPDGKRLATCAADRTVKIWNVADGKLLFTFSESTDWNYTVAWRPGGKQLAAAGVDKSIRVWDVNEQGGRIVHAVFAHEGPVMKVIYGKDGKTLYSLGQDRVIKAWDAERMVERKVYPARPDTVLCFAVRPDEKQIALGRYDGVVELLDTESGKFQVAQLPAAAPVVPTSMQKSPDKTPADPFPVTQVGTGSNSPGRAQPIKPPVSLVGKLERAGDIDFFRLDAKAGQSLGIQAVTAGSKVEPILQVTDLRGRVLAESTNGLLGHTFVDAGSYTVSIRDREFRGGKDMHYRLHVGELPIVTAVSPLGAQRGAEVDVRLEGVFLASKSAKVKVPADAMVGSKVSVPVKSSLGQPLGEAKLVVGEFPEVHAGSSLPVPGTANGLLAQPGQRDEWRFHAKKGTRLIIETQAQLIGSGLDSLIEILDAAGNPVPRAVLRCQAKTFVTFRDHDSAAAGIRIDAWNDLAVNDYLYVGSELMKIKALPPHPDADCSFVSAAGGPRVAFLDTTPTHHSQNVPMYKVSIHPPGTTFPPNGFPVFTLFYRNDDGGPGYSRDSRIFFDPPADGEYRVRISDTRGQGGVSYGYRLTVRPPRPSFNVRFSPTNPTVPKEGAVPLTISVDRLDGYDGPINLRFDNVPAGFSVPRTEMQAGETTTAVALYADADVKTPAKAEPAKAEPAKAEPAKAQPAKAPPFKLIAEAVIDGQKLVKEAAGETPKATAVGEIVTFTDESEVSIRPGGEVKIQVHIERRGGFTGRVPLDVKGLPHGVRVLDIGLNGILITEKETRRTIVLHAEPWVQPTEHPFVILARREGKNTEHAAKSVLLKVAK